MLRAEKGGEPGDAETRNASKSCNESDKSEECGRSYVFMYFSVNYISILLFMYPYNNPYNK